MCWSVLSLYACVTPHWRDRDICVCSFSVNLSRNSWDRHKKKEVGIHHIVDLIAFPGVLIMRKQGRMICKLGRGAGLNTWATFRLKREISSFCVLAWSWTVEYLIILMSMTSSPWLWKDQLNLKFPCSY